MELKDKHILITAGPTWVAIDKVRVLSNIATGETGILLAKAFSAHGAKVTIIIGPCGHCPLGKKIKVLRFNYFEEFKKILFNELKSVKYDCLIHSAAVSDYRPKKIYHGKINSNLRSLDIKLEPLPKIINSIKSRARGIKLVGFKFEPEALKVKLIKDACLLLKKAKADFIVANTLYGGNYRAYIVSPKETLGPFLNKKLLANSLINVLGKLPITNYHLPFTKL